MQKNAKLKLIAVIDLHNLRLYEAQGSKILKETENFSLESYKGHRHNRGIYQLGHNASHSPASAFEPHTQPKDLELLETAKIVASHLEKTVTEHHNYNEVIIVATSKILGHLRKEYSKNVEKIITKEISKDLVHYQRLEEIEEVVFS